MINYWLIILNNSNILKSINAISWDKNLIIPKSIWERKRRINSLCPSSIIIILNGENKSIIGSRIIFKVSSKYQNLFWINLYSCRRNKDPKLSNRIIRLMETDFENIPFILINMIEFNKVNKFEWCRISQASYFTNSLIK